MTAPLLALSGLASAYGQSQVLWDVELMLAPGTATALIGRNGVGKSTLLGAIMGTRTVTGGNISFDPEIAIPQSGNMFRDPVLGTSRSGKNAKPTIKSFLCPT